MKNEGAAPGEDCTYIPQMLLSQMCQALSYISISHIHWKNRLHDRSWPLEGLLGSILGITSVELLGSSGVRMTLGSCFKLSEGTWPLQSQTYRYMGYLYGGETTLEE
jgi:hypothetical protein